MRGRLLDATVECLVRYGYAGTTTTRVTEIAGVTRGAQVHHFPTRADLIAATVRHLAARRAELAFEKIDAVRQATDPIDAVLDLMWEIHQGSLQYAAMEMWVAARTDPELCAQLTEVEPEARAALLKFTATAFADYVDHPRFQHVMYTALDTVRGLVLLGLSNSDIGQLDTRWKRAKSDLRLLIDAALAQPSDRISGAR
jgi:AcrR family transcriptional regulator